MDDIRIDVKPLSVNRAWQGKRYKSDEYSKYERIMLLSLPAMQIPAPPYRIYYEFGFSNRLSDYDNPVKATQDCLQKKYKFNDCDIYEAFIRKRIVEKGKEYIRIKFEHIDIEGYGKKRNRKKSAEKTDSKRKTAAVCPDIRIPRKRKTI